MNNIWAPWRTEYVKAPKSNDGCIFCDAPNLADPLMIVSGSTCYAIMNRYPYAAGHCMVLPYRHAGDLTELEVSERAELLDLAARLEEALRTALKPTGFNIGFNIGSDAGAGFAGHLHLHIVPRWPGDTNFMPVLADVHMISEHIEATCARIKAALK
ncbi:MAG: AP-4-A phosphorylase [Deltaproteobacteria bacterium ADurb.Bin510]|jgi:ATP adenylyltransferase|nr:MAG: AP-4-A phosphorylase [Deltaproteobacteria bacterium ADurb.Bin510]